jgi:hypothetical protein
MKQPTIEDRGDEKKRRAKEALQCRTDRRKLQKGIQRDATTDGTTKKNEDIEH